MCQRLLGKKRILKGAFKLEWQWDIVLLKRGKFKTQDQPQVKTLLFKLGSESPSRSSALLCLLVTGWPAVIGPYGQALI